MNTLTKNRILENGDEYLSGREWKPVPARDWGMQIMFTKYAQVRRPREEPPKEHKCIITQKNDFKGAPANGTATMPTPIAATTAKAASPEPKSSTPTIDRLIDRENITLTPPTTTLDVDGTALTLASAIQIQFSKTSPYCQWIGRNGTYHQVALNMNRKDGVITIKPSGKRGVARNAEIEFPVEILPQLTDWLLQQQLETKLTKK